MFNKIAAMTKKRCCALAVAVLAVGVLAVAVPGMTVFANMIDLAAQCSLTVHPGDIPDLENAEVVIDLYKVADAVEEEGYDTYGYSATAAFSLLAEDLTDTASLTTERYQMLADQAAKLVLDSGMSIQKTVDGAATDQAMTGLDCGLYLVIARGANIPRYVVDTEDGKLATIAYSGEYTYTFLPELISFPGTASVLTGEVGEEGNRQEINTGDGEWVYDITATLKPSQSERFGSLEIVKNLLSYEISDPASFVFQVEAYEDETKEYPVYSNVVSISFTSAGQKRVLLEDVIPVGSYVEITEVYSGAVYHLVTEEMQTAVIEAEEIASVKFTNDYEEINRGGGAVTNHFEYESETGWGWTKIPDAE